MKKYIAEQWAFFEEHVLRAAGPVQRQEMRRAFYGGARAMYNVLLHNVSNSPEFTDEDQDLGDSIEAEFAEFLVAVKEGRA
jgi:hypothetical protein